MTGSPTPTDGDGVTRILYLSEGDAETHDSWSGVSRSILEHLRAAGYSVRAGDADLYGAKRWWTVLRSFSMPMRRWWVRYHLGATAFVARSAACAKVVAARRGSADVILQIGATFAIPEDERTPLVLFCDSNIELARAAIDTGHSEAAVLTPAERDGVREREARVYSRAALIFTMSDFLRRSFIEHFGIPAERLVTLHCGPNIPVPEFTDGLDARADGPPTILFVGRDFHRKGAYQLLEAFAEVRAEIPEARLVMVGGGRNAQRMAAPPGVEFVGFLSRDTESGRRRMDSAYRSAHVFCIPTRFEPFGTSFVEAMMYGLPCVGPAAWAVPEIIDDGRTGLLIPPGDRPALVQALTRLLRDRGEARRMGEAARVRALERFSWAHLMERMSAGLASVVAAASGSL